MLRYVPAVLSFALTVYCLVDAFQTDEADMRNLPKIAWILLVLLVPVIGPVGWLLAGRPRRNSVPRRQQQRWEEHRREQERRRPRGPDDDPDFLKDL
ncbi:MAG TPA: PLD nuclease N-terminal domain-containing protein [Ornithinibacter sp.]|nr:PLD nuclease N-terminal domain-containing protein [Ornithinibacter sp.]